MPAAEKEMPAAAGDAPSAVRRRKSPTARWRRFWQARAALERFPAAFGAHNPSSRFPVGGFGRFWLAKTAISMQFGAIRLLKPAVDMHSLGAAERQCTKQARSCEISAGFDSQRALGL